MTYADLKRDPSLRNDYFDGVAFQKMHDSSLEHIQNDMKAGRNLSAADLRHLTREELENVRNKGEGHLKEIVQEHTRQRERERER
jgi:hypothetical protein